MLTPLSIRWQLFNLDKSPAVTPINKEISECRPGLNKSGLNWEGVNM